MFLYRLEKLKDVNKCVLVCSENEFVPNWVASYDELRSAINAADLQCTQVELPKPIAMCTIYILHPRQTN